MCLFTSSYHITLHFWIDQTQSSQICNKKKKTGLGLGWSLYFTQASGNGETLSVSLGPVKEHFKQVYVSGLDQKGSDQGLLPHSMNFILTYVAKIKYRYSISCLDSEKEK